MPSSRRLRVALLADSFNPEWPSLPIVTFKYAKALARLADVTVITQIRNRPNIEKLGNLGFSVEYIDTEYVSRPISKIATWLRGGKDVGWTIDTALRYPTYLEFERRALRRLEHSGRNWDVVHRISPMAPYLPSYAAGRTKAPFIIGPLNGGLPWPAQFMEEQARELDVLSRVKGVHKILPFYRSTYQNAAAILASFPHTIALLDRRWSDRILDVPEIGYDPDLFYPAKRERGERITFLYAGRLVPYKLPEIAIAAFAARPELRQHKLRIAGSGPDQERLTTMVGQHEMQDCVEFIGKLSQDQIAAEMRAADVFFFPSIRELGAGVVIEALACGLPCLVADYGAPGALVDSSRGRKVAIDTKDKMVEAFAAAAVDLASNPAELDRMAERAAQYAATHFTWERKAQTTMEIYNWVLSGRGTPRPNFQY